MDRAEVYEHTTSRILDQESVAHQRSYKLVSLISNKILSYSRYCGINGKRHNNSNIPASSSILHVTATEH